MYDTRFFIEVSFICDSALEEDGDNCHIRRLKPTRFLTSMACFDACPNKEGLYLILTKAAMIW
jgi:hypothetical protein